MCRLLLAQDLYLNSNKIGDDGMIAFSDAISKGSLGSLQILRLSTNKIGDEGMIKFAEALKPNPSNPNGALANLQKLFLGANQIGDAGVTALAGVIASGSMGLLTVRPSLLPTFLPIALALRASYRLHRSWACLATRLGMTG